MLAAWPLVCLMLFMRWSAPQALVGGLLAGYLLLPSATKFDLVGLPDLDKSSMIAIGIGFGSMIFSGRRVGQGGALWFYVLGSIFVLTPFVTARLNGNPIVAPRLFFPGLTWYDGLSQAGVNLFALVPLWAGRRLLSDERGHALIIRTLVTAMLAYSLLVLVEIRLSPQLHRWVYGFFPHDFAQQVRAGGFRAVVFLSHGLVVAMFLALGFIAAVAMARTRSSLFGVSYWLWALYLLVILLLQKSLGAAVLGLIVGLVVFGTPPKWQLRLATIGALLVASYPIMRGSQLLPIDTVQSITASISSDRASSLDFRLANEEQLLAKAAQRPAFGWGGWGRNRVFDLEQGRDVSTTDGTWIIILGSYGWVGYLAMFGLLTLPVLRLRHVYRKVRDVPRPTAAVALLLTFNLFDLIPNSSLSPLTWLLAGALLGHRRKGPFTQTRPKALLLAGAESGDLAGDGPNGRVSGGGA